MIAIRVKIGLILPSTTIGALVLGVGQIPILLKMSLLTDKIQGIV